MYNMVKGIQGMETSLTRRPLSSWGLDLSFFCMKYSFNTTRTPHEQAIVTFLFS